MAATVPGRGGMMSDPLTFAALIVAAVFRMIGSIMRALGLV